MSLQYSTEIDLKAYKLALLGATQGEMADFFEISVKKFEHWLSDNPSLREAVKAGAMAADSEVAYKLFGRATGCSVTKQRVLNDGSVVSYKEELPPDTKAATFWLSCRSQGGRGQWIEKSAVQHSGDAENPLAFILGDLATEAEESSALPGKK